nr:hypothetical protein [Tanacetum cinerariifolium]
VGLAEIDVSILLISASTPVISSELVVGTGKLTVGMEDFTVSVSICLAEGLNVEAVELGFRCLQELESCFLHKAYLK